MTSLTINLCTRGRPDLLIETIERTLPNISRDDTTFLISIDQDDEKTIAALPRLPKDSRVVPLVLPREDSFGGKYNRALVYAPADVYLPMVDYGPHITPRFDQKILDAAAVFPDGVGVVYNHYCCDAELPAINGITAGLAEKMGYLYPTYFPFSFVDLWMDDVVRLIDRIAFCDVDIDRSKRPQTIGRRDVRFWGVLLDLLYPERVACAKSIIGSADFADPAWRKEYLLTRFPLHATHSCRISRESRHNATWNDRFAYFETPQEEERYKRIKARGEKLMRELVAKYDVARLAVAAE